MLLWLLAATTAGAKSDGEVTGGTPPEGPWIVSTSPAPGTEARRDPIITITFASMENPVDLLSIRWFIGTNLVGGIIEQPIEGGVEIRYWIANDLPLGSTQAVTVIFRGQHPASPTITNAWTFYVGPLKGRNRSLFVEAEDFNYSDDGVTGGLYANLGDPECSLMNKGGIPGIDYFQTSGHDPNAVPAYRPNTDVEAAKPATNLLSRADRTITCNYIVGWNDVGEWQNYTRAFTEFSTRYNVYARVSSGGAAEAIEFAQITSDPTQSNQTKRVVGEFRSPPTGNWDVFHHLSLQDTCGRPLSLLLAGTNTFRLTALPGNFDIDYFVFVQADYPFLPDGLTFTGNGSRLWWSSGDLQAAPSIAGPWTNYIGAVSPLTIDARNGTLFFRTVCF